jgi:hypothetical protein
MMGGMKGPMPPNNTDQNNQPPSAWHPDSQPAPGHPMSSENHRDVNSENKSTTETEPDKTTH